MRIALTLGPLLLAISAFVAYRIAAGRSRRKAATFRATAQVVVKPQWGQPLSPRAHEGAKAAPPPPLSPPVADRLTEPLPRLPVKGQQPRAYWDWS